MCVTYCWHYIEFTENTSKNALLKPEYNSRCFRNYWNTLSKDWLGVTIKQLYFHVIEINKIEQTRHLYN